MADVFPADSAWKPVKIGAGGWLTGIDIASDGTMVARTDTYGAYLWNGTSWEQLVTAESMPEGSVRVPGAYEIKIAPSDSNILYMAMGGYVYKSTDRGEHWVKTGFPQVNMMNLDNRMDGQKMAVDPANPDIVFLGTQHDGLFVTRDGGATWQKVTGVPQGADAASSNDPGLTGILFDPAAGADGGGTRVIYAGTAGSGVFRSTDGGLTWSALSGGPKDVSHAAISSDGSLYVAGNSDGSLWKFAGGVWTKLLDNSVHAVAIDPFNMSHIVVVTPGGSLQESMDGGATWTGWIWSSGLESSDDIPWLENSGAYMSTGGLLFDPLVPGRLWQSAGVGVWSTDLPSNLTWNSFITWNSHSAGIEQLVTNDIIAPVGGHPIFGSWDRPFFEVSDLDSYASSYSGGKFSMGWSLDYASTDSSFVTGISDWWGVENSGYSTDGGHTWQKFASLPSFALGSVGGSIAASSPTNIIWAPAGGSAPAYTLDGGNTWNTVNIAGLTDWSGFHHAYYLNRTTITADRILANTFYLYDVGSGVYVTRDGGANWSQVYKGPIGDWSYWNAKIEAVPGSAGELFFTPGAIHGPNETWSYLPLMHSKDGGSTWQAIENVGVGTFGYGAPATPGGPATIFIVGTVDGEYGIWYSVDDAESWTQIGRHPMGSLDQVNTISGDMDQFGMVYVGFGGSGYAYFDLTDSQPGPGTDPSTPSQVATIASAFDNVGNLANVGSGAIINDATPTLSGDLSSELAAGQILVVYRDGERLAELSPTTRSWSFTDTGAPDGTHQYSVRVENMAGEVGSYSPAFSLTIDTLAPNQLVIVTGASTTLGARLTQLSSATAAASLITGTISGDLAPGESLIVFRDGVRVGVGTVSNGSWSFTDNVASGSYKYSAQVQDAAGNLGQLSNPYVISVGSTFISGTNRNDVLVGTAGDDYLSGVPNSGLKIGKGTVDTLKGAGGADVFVIGDSRGRFYDDASSRKSGAGDYARITDFGADDKLQLKGAAAEYLQRWTAIKNVSGTGIYHDTNGNGAWDSRDELIALVQGHGPLDPDNMLFM